MQMRDARLAASRTRLPPFARSRCLSASSGLASTRRRLSRTRVRMRRSDCKSGPKLRISNSNSASSSRKKRQLGLEPISDSTKGKQRVSKASSKHLSRGRRTLDGDETKTEAHGNKANELDRDKPSSPEQKQVYEEFVRDALAKGIAGVLNEYRQELTPYIPSGATRVAFDANPSRNRYQDVVCTDQSRVMIKGPNDYIHANYVRGGPLVNVFICTQGPTMGTVKDFWRMVVQENVGNIIMLCDTIELGKEKCNQYWPREEGCSVEWPGIQVKNVRVDNSDSTTVVSTLEVMMEKRDKLSLKHHHWRTWPDKSVPGSVLAPFRLLKLVRHNSKPTVVHCSAGIGRTGSVVALEVCYQRLLGEKPLSVLEQVKWLRQRRMHSVQTDMQYLYLYKCLITMATKYKLVPPDCAGGLQKFDEEYQRLLDEKNKGEKKELYTPLVPLRRK